MEEILHFPLSIYIEMIHINLDDFMSFIADCIRCRREGIPVLKSGIPSLQKVFKVFMVVHET